MEPVPISFDANAFFRGEAFTFGYRAQRRSENSSWNCWKYDSSMESERFSSNVDPPRHDEESCDSMRATLSNCYRQPAHSTPY